MLTAYEGQRIKSQMIDQIVGQEIKRQNAELAERHRAEVRAVERDRDMMRQAYTGYWARKIRAARRKYGHNPNPPRWARALLGVYGLIILEVGETWKYLERWNRSA